MYLVLSNKNSVSRFTDNLCPIFNARTAFYLQYFASTLLFIYDCIMSCGLCNTDASYLHQLNYMCIIRAIYSMWIK